MNTALFTMDSVVLAFPPLTLWHPLLPDGYSYKTSCDGLICHLYFLTSGHYDAQPKASECPDVKKTNDALIRSGTGCFIAVPIWQQRVKTNINHPAAIPRLDWGGGSFFSVSALVPGDADFRAAAERRRERKAVEILAAVARVDRRDVEDEEQDHE